MKNAKTLNHLINYSNIFLIQLFNKFMAEAMYTVWHDVCKNNYSHIVVCKNNY